MTMLNPTMFIDYFNTPCMTIGEGCHLYDTYTKYVSNGVSKMRVKADSYEKAMDTLCKYFNTTNLIRKNVISSGVRYYRMLPRIKLKNFTITEVIVKLIS